MRKTWAIQDEDTGGASLCERGCRILVVDDDEGMRNLLRTTLEVIDIEVDEADSAESAARQIALRAPDVVLLDVRMPGMDGLAFCRQLKTDPATSEVSVVLLTAEAAVSEEAARLAGADALLGKPFSPLELLTVIENLSGGLYEGPFRAPAADEPGEQTLLYAHDLRRLLELERGQRLLLQAAYRDTVKALASALESRDTLTRAHSQRVQRYALELAAAVDPGVLDDPSAEYGFLLHDVGKIGIPDTILLKPGPLTIDERRLMQTHTVLGERMLSEIEPLQGEGLRIVRSHHERWDGAGYPDGLVGSQIPLGARVFAVADAIDAITSTRPYREAAGWRAAVSEVDTQRGRQFDPAVVDAFRKAEPDLRRIYTELVAA